MENLLAIRWRGTREGAKAPIHSSVVEWHQLVFLSFVVKNGLPKKGFPFFPGSLSN